jgi:RNA polymerase sigma-70 factor (ECF subfamily)
VREAVAALPAEQRAAVELAYFGGKTYTEVAETLGIPEGTAKSRLRLAMKKLAASLGAEGVNQWN